MKHEEVSSTTTRKQFLDSGTRYRRAGIDRSVVGTKYSLITKHITTAVWVRGSQIDVINLGSC
jgi:hypothetical protein